MSYVFFWLENDHYGEFSNWYSSDVNIDDFLYMNTEQYFMAEKARLFHDAVTRQKIMTADTAELCKKLGKQVTPFDAKQWDAAKYGIMKKAVREKFRQNPSLKALLLGTGDNYIAEASPGDAIWGIGLSADKAAKIPQDQWPGQNLLGKILMEVREELRECNSFAIKMLKGDITKLSDVDAIVNAANRSLLGGGGVDGAIHRAAGPKLLDACRKLNGCNTGEAKITDAFNLNCKYIIHTVGPIWQGGSNQEQEELQQCYENTLQLAVDHHIRRIAFPSISTGIYHFPVDLAAKIAINTTKKFVREHPNTLELVEWVLFDDQTYNVYLGALLSDD